MNSQVIEMLIKLLSKKNEPQQEQYEKAPTQNFSSSCFNLPNYEQDFLKNSQQEKTFQTNNAGIDISSLIELLPSIFNLFQNKNQNETKIREEIPSYINSLHKIDN